MKKILICALILVSVTFAAAPSTISALVADIMAIPAEQLIAEEVVAKILGEGVDDALKYNDVDFDIGYYNVRSITYSQKSLEQFSGYDPFNNYVAMRTVVVAKVKEYLHTGDNLKAMYLKHRPAIQAKFKVLPPAAKIRAQAKIASAYGTFAAFKNGDVQKRFIAFQEAERSRHSNRFADLSLLGSNTSAEGVAQAVASGELERGDKAEEAEKAFLAQFKDPDLAKFAGRRVVEGGEHNALLEKYLEVITLMLEDATM